jgi:hypothetical protein
VVDTGDKFTINFKDSWSHISQYLLYIDLGDTGKKFASSVIRDISTLAVNLLAVVARPMVNKNKSIRLPTP